ncbi:uncharacterized protein [Clytia hemisphaerica]|uniref:uncharacterized protein n=1 Tax=Clytia hemisphaerica TaxID=252671 RepID=UPI0034D71387
MLKHTPVNTTVGDQLLDKKIKVEEESDLRFQINESRTSGPAFPQPSQTAVLPHQELNSSRPPALPAFQHPRERYSQQPSNSHQTLPTSFQPHQNEPPTINRTPMPAFLQPKQEPGETAFLQPKQEPGETQFDFQQSHQTIQHLRHQIQSQQPTLQQTLDVINGEVNETVNSSQWSDPLAYLPRGMEDFKGFFTPDQLNILQLLHQRQVLDKLEQRVKNSTTDYLPPDTIEEVIDSGVGFVPTNETTEPTMSYSTHGQPGTENM